MKKNVAGQFVQADLVAKADGSAVTSGTTTVYVSGDGGAQAAGAGAVTHKGNGAWQYAPTQAETNYDHVAYTFVNTLAPNVTLNLYPSFPQTGDAFARVGANGAGLTALPWNAAWDAEVESEVDDALQAKGYTAARAALLSNLDAAISTRLSAAGYTVPPTAAAIRAEMDANSADLNTIIDALVVLTTRLTAARAALLDNLTNLDMKVSEVTGGGGGGGGATAAQVWDLASAIDGYTPREIMRGLAAVILGEDVSDEASQIEYRLNDASQVRLTATIANRKRTNTVLNLG